MLVNLSILRLYDMKKRKFICVKVFFFCFVFFLYRNTLEVIVLGNIIAPPALNGGGS